MLCQPVRRLLRLSLLIAALVCQQPVLADDAAPTETDVAVGLARVERLTLRAYVTAYGAVEAEPAQGGRPPASALVAAPSAGLVAEAHCEEGQRVRRGQVLFRLEHRLADVQVEKARTVLALAEKNLERKRVLGKDDNVSQKLVDEARQQRDAARQDLALAEAQRALLQVEAPLAGTVVKVHARPGEAVGGNAVLAELVDLDRLVVNAAVPGAEARRLRPNQPALLSAASETEPMQQGRGKLAFIGYQVDPRTATLPVRIALPADSGLKPGQFIRVRMVVEERTDRLAVPVESLVTETGQSAIYLASGGRAVRTPVRTGLRDGGFVEVEGEGVQAGMAVVTQGAWGLPAASRIHPVQP